MKASGIVSLFLALVLLLGAVLPSYAEGGFTFRNGLHWGMTKEEVFQAEGNPKVVGSSSIGSHIKYSQVSTTLSKFNVYGSFFFVDDGLALAEFFGKASAEDVDYLINALSMVYGEAHIGDGINSLLAMALQANNVPLEGYQTAAASWYLPDGTLIQLFKTNSGFDLYYGDANTDLMAALATPAPATFTPAPVTEAPAGGFSFRNGIHWGMTEDQILKSENYRTVIQTSTIAGKIRAVALSTSLSKFNATGVYYFVEDQGLQLVEFFAKASAADVEYLTGAMNSVYGEAHSGDAINTLLAMALQTNGVSVQNYQTAVASWYPTATTVIQLFRTSTGFDLYYGNGEFDLVSALATPQPTFNTQGL